MPDYTGEVTQGGPPAVRDLPALTITKVSVGPADNNAYLLRSKSTGASVLIDAANEAPTLLALIPDGLQAIITTHRHGDHWQALAAVTTATGAPTYAGRADAPAIPVPTTTPVDDGDTLHIDDIELTAIHLVGHTPGSIALLYQVPTGTPHLFTGDCLFPGGVGNTFGDSKAFTTLYDGVVTKIFDRLPDDTWVYPGHGKDTTLGAERPQLAEWRKRGW
ncbi:beta-lactamase domain protein [Catenulispora acidiphila DSM 44928]|uniref:Beta-lactamase domain protein n=1 Tax=Catenulispora acidiphila (strain DSM 44928 / JCM 14897 / NBRC 102108 / NRRL B-24433 / ID139908) TaxID=479433 RepID=C7QB05_CATAD|nr:MBL fold metallo-hydrolase [Catenulispora acidiphila]ACU74478.1 beta-lactamase domain protein [Catenulispora acidiphila DSM 44928]